MIPPTVRWWLGFFLSPGFLSLLHLEKVKIDLRVFGGKRGFDDVKKRRSTLQYSSYLTYI